MELMEIRRRLLTQPRRIRVVWNNYQPPFSTELYRPYGTDTNIEDAGTGVVRQTWVVIGGGYRRTFRLKENFPTVQTDHVYYLSYCFNAPVDGMLFSTEFAGGIIPIAIPSVANEWVRFSAVSGGNKNGLGVAYFLNYRGGTSLLQESEVLVKSPLYVDLTVMFGAGNEPSLAEFERQCALNGIDLNASQNQDNGTQRLWMI